MKNPLLEKRLTALLDRRKQKDALRQAKYNPNLIDFCSNDYLGISQSSSIREYAQELLKQHPSNSGATGSRLLTGHYPLLEEAEKYLAQFHKATAALIFNSGYDANLGLLSSLTRRQDLLFYDDLVHASIHDGMKMSAAQKFAFQHNSTQHLRELLEEHANPKRVVFILVESIYSMDGDKAPLVELAKIAQEYQAYLVVDEAHSTGIYGESGEGLCVELGIQEQVFARLHTFGKAIGGHGAAIVGNQTLIQFLFNYARSLIYTTALPPHSVAHILAAYSHLSQDGKEKIKDLKEKINYFKNNLTPKIQEQLIPSDSPIQSLIVGGNEKTRQLAQDINNQGFDIRPILAPTVPVGTERLRICLHQFNTKNEILGLCKQLNSFYEF
ncbi:MAG: 8-amino-7-oxononanoate synthase [Saprospiraceae bacterium]|nr:8-amino-7-oxononanoate synthase [Saprospiraceae bacterium]